MANNGIKNQKELKEKYRLLIEELNKSMKSFQDTMKETAIIEIPNARYHQTIRSLQANGASEEVVTTLQAEWDAKMSELLDDLIYLDFYIVDLEEEEPVYLLLSDKGMDALYVQHQVLHKRIINEFHYIELMESLMEFNAGRMETENFIGVWWYTLFTMKCGELGSHLMNASLKEHYPIDFSYEEVDLDVAPVWQVDFENNDVFGSHLSSLDFHEEVIKELKKLLTHTCLTMNEIREDLHKIKRFIEQYPIQHNDSK